MSNNGKFISYETIIYCFLFGGQNVVILTKLQAYMQQSSEENVSTWVAAIRRGWRKMHMEELSRFVHFNSYDLCG